MMFDQVNWGCAGQVVCNACGEHAMWNDVRNMFYCKKDGRWYCHFHRVELDKMASIIRG